MTTGSRHILHLCTGLQSSTAPVASLLDRPGWQVSVVTDVYSAMAIVATSAPGSIQALVACVDGLSESDMELFDLLRERFPAVRVYVYGDSRGQSRIERAMRTGAAGIIELKASVETGPPPGETGNMGHRREISLAEAMAQNRGNIVAGDPPCAPPAQPRSEWSSLSEARVPWIPHPQAPRRIPPAGSVSSSADSLSNVDRPQSVAPDARNPISEPLLSTEEMAALMNGWNSPKR